MTARGATCTGNTPSRSRRSPFPASCSTPEDGFSIARFLAPSCATEWAATPSSHARIGRAFNDDLRALTDQLVSLTVVADPFGNFTEDLLRRAFEVVLPYKQHYVTDLSLPIERWIGRRHRRNVEKSLGLVELEVCPDPLELLDVWAALYAELIERHGITGLRTFSRTAFEKQLGVPGVAMFKASIAGHVVGLHIWYVHDEVAYGHLGATSARGYDVMASYALYWHAIEYLRARVRWLDLGAAAGLSDARGDSGLNRFKAGWSNGVRQTYLCGRVFQPAVYSSLAEARGIGATSVIPRLSPGRVR